MGGFCDEAKKRLLYKENDKGVSERICSSSFKSDPVEINVAIRRRGTGVGPI